MAGFTNQQHIRNFRYTSVSDAQTQSSNARNTDVCFVFETKKSYYYVDGDTSTVDGNNILNANSGNGRWISSSIPTLPVTDVFILSIGDVSNGYVDLSQSYDVIKHVDVYINGLIMEAGATADYELVGQRITFHTTVDAADKVLVKYYH